MLPVRQETYIECSDIQLTASAISGLAGYVSHLLGVERKICSLCTTIEGALG